ncbi:MULTISPECIES: hypothetical protein [Vibrio]|nr:MULTISPECIES: hypothetical protein [Vibrio]
MTQEMKQALETLRQAIQEAEQFGLVRTETGQVITGAIETENGIVLTEN